MRKRIGTEDAGYLFEEELGMGGFGAVYRASNSGKTVAVKVLLADLMATPQAVQRFEREIEAIRSIAHPSCIEIYDSGRLSDGSPYFSMELLEGEDLAQKLRRDGRMSGDEVLRILRPVCDALQLAHQQSVVHRDIKASNVFLCADGRVMLLDFGIAKFVDMPGMTLTLSQQLVGTPCAMAPEQSSGGSIDSRTDVYALGALAYYMLTGSRAFSTSSPTMMRQLHRHAARPRPSARAPVSPAIDPVIVCAMSIDPSRRPLDAAAFLRSFESAHLGRDTGHEELVLARTVFAFLGDCGEDDTLASRGRSAMDQALRSLSSLGYELLSMQSRGFVCARAISPSEDEELMKVKEELEAAAPEHTEMRWKEGQVLRRGGAFVSGEALIPRFEVESEGQL